MINFQNKKNLYFILSSLLLLFAYYCSLTVGISWDELFVVNRGEQRLKYLYSLGNAEIRFDSNQYFPGFFDTIAIFFTKIFPKKYTINALHLFNTTFSILTIIGVYKFSKIIFNKTIGYILAILLYFNPIFFGHMAINSKDTIISFAFIWTFVTLLRYLKVQNNKEKRKKLIIYASLFIGIGLGTRIQFIGLLFFLLPYIFFNNNIKSKVFSFKKFFRDTFIILVSAYFIMISFWPHVHSNIFLEPFKIFIETFNIKAGPPVLLFDGKTVAVTDVPINYIFTNLFYKTPEFIIFLYLFFFLTILIDLKFYNKHFKNLLIILLIVFLIIIFPTLLIIFSNMGFYDGIRYFLFIIPFFLMLPSLSIYYIFKNMNKIYIKISFLFTSLLILFYLLTFFTVTPFQYTYINSLIFDKNHITKKFEYDYWGISLKQLVKKIDELDNMNFNKTKYLGICGFNVDILNIELKKYPKLNFEVVGLNDIRLEYVITNNRSLYPILDNNNKNWVNCYDQFSSDNIIEVKKNNIVLSSFKKAN